MSRTSTKKLSAETVVREPCLAQRAIDAPLGLSTMRIFLWLVSVAAALGLLSLFVLHDSIVFTIDSSKPLESKKLETSAGLEGAVCSFPVGIQETQDEYSP